MKFLYFKKSILTKFRYKTGEFKRKFNAWKSRYPLQIREGILRLARMSIVCPKLGKFFWRSVKNPQTALKHEYSDNILKGRH